MSALSELRGYLNYQWGTLSGSGTELECVGLPIDNAARAVVALAEEQRTANLIAFLDHVQHGAGGDVDNRAYNALHHEIVTRLDRGDAA